MIRKYVSSQQNKKGTKKIVNYILRDEACCLFETDLLHSPTISKKDLANRFSSDIDDDVKFYNSNRTVGSTQKVRTYHDIVSFHTNDDMNPQKALQIAKELYEKTHKLSNRKYFMAVHNDTDEMHVHIVWAVRDNDGKTYKQDHDYRVIERECDKLENKHGLIKPKNRIATDMDRLNNHPYLKGKSEALKKRAVAKAINKKYSEKLPSSNERMLDVRGIISNKTQMKEALKPYLDNSSSPSDFINRITDGGFTVIHNSKSAFSIQLDDQIFKASELNISYKTLKIKLGEDDEFEKTLAKKHQAKPKSEDCSLVSSDEKPDYMKKIKPNSVLATKFQFIQHSDKVEYFYNSASSKKSFEYYKDPSKVLFNDTSRQSAKAGIQRLIADAKPPQSFTVNGPDYFKKNVWLEFQLMGLEAKGFKLEGYKPTPADLETLKKTQEKYESMNKKPEPKPESPTMAIEAPKPVEPAIVPPVMATPVKNAPEKTAEPTKQVEQEQAAPSNDDLIDELDKMFKPTPQDILRDVLSKATQEMLCVAHSSITCRLCFGVDFEKAPVDKVTEFKKLNTELFVAYTDHQRLKSEFDEIINNKIDDFKSTREYQEKAIAAHIKDVETDFRSFIDELVSNHDDYSEIEILKTILDVLDGTLVYDAALYLDIAEKINQLDEGERAICSAYVQMLLDNDGSGAPIDGELKQTSKIKLKLKI